MTRSMERRGALKVSFTVLTSCTDVEAKYVSFNIM